MTRAGIGRALACIALLGLGVKFFAQLAPQTATLAPYDSYSRGITEATAFLRQLSGRFPGGVTLVIPDATPPERLNRLPEIALTPVGGVSGYIFPYLSALNGSSFSVQSRDAFCAAGLANQGVALVAPSLEAAGGVGSASGVVQVRLQSGYTAVMRMQDYRGFIGAFRPYLSNEMLSEGAVAVLPLRSDDPAVTVIDRSWGGDHQFLVISPTPTLRLRPIVPAGPESVLMFGPHPLGGWPARGIALTYAGRSSREILEQPPAAGRFVLPLSGLEAIDVDMDEAAFAAPFGGYVFVLHAPAVSTPVEVVPGTTPGVPMCGAVRAR